MWNLKGRTGAAALVLGLSDFCKYIYGDIVIIKGNVEHGPAEHLVPKHCDLPGSHMK